MTTFETLVFNETIRRESKSKLSWSQQHAEDAPYAPRPAFPLDSQEHARLDKFREKVADLCDLQPTSASMVRPPRKVSHATDRCTAYLHLRSPPPS